MRITLVVDAISPQLTGIGRYAFELSERLPYHIQDVNYFNSGRWIPDPRQLLSEGNNQERKAVRLRFPKAIRSKFNRHKMRSRLVHAPNYFLPEEASDGIITVHDLSVLHYPETHPIERVNHFERLFLSSLNRASHVITDTETVRKELILNFGIPHDKITAIALGLDPAFRPRSVAELSIKLNEIGLSPNTYGLCVSTFEPRKNIHQLIQAWRMLPPALRSTYKLVLAGGEGWLNESLHDVIRAYENEGWLKHLGFVSKEALPSLYAGATVFVYPSSYEGFGLPPVEAMASGIPTIVANRSCLPEVCGDAPMFVDPNNLQGFSLAIEQSLTDQQWRASATVQGLSQAHQYDWDRCVNETILVYDKVFYSSLDAAAARAFSKTPASSDPP
ncbi:MAG TPA: glycosyltransferase family 1 protein [Anaerolineales bacterium]|nr:glycosyltransferase family 1 protein [Anaerolineales bacterium]